MNEKQLRKKLKKTVRMYQRTTIIIILIVCFIAYTLYQDSIRKQKKKIQDLANTLEQLNDFYTSFRHEIILKLKSS